MKKLLAGISFGVLLVTGFALVDNSGDDLAYEREPSIFSVQQSTVEL